MKLEVRTIPHNDQRYDTCGDYWTDKDGIHFRISKMGAPQSEWLVLIHELIEKALCELRTIDERAIDEFDSAWKGHSGYEEPGCDPEAPYYREHMFAMHIERLLADEIGIRWDTHDQNVMGLEYKKNGKNGRAH